MKKNYPVYQFARKKGEEIQLSLLEFKDRLYIDLRLFFRPKDSDEMKPTKKGITVDVALLNELKKGVYKCEKEASQIRLKSDTIA